VVEQVEDQADQVVLEVELMHQVVTHLPTLVVVEQETLVDVVVEVQVVLGMLLLLIQQVNFIND
jgi:hypothetical protein